MAYIVNNPHRASISIEESIPAARFSCSTEF